MKTGYFFDMDGTLYSHRFHEVSRYTIKVLDQLQKQGHLVGLATSRAKAELVHLPALLANFRFDIQILDGGAWILDSDGNTLVRSVMKQEDMDWLDAYAKQEKIVYRYSTTTGNYWGTYPSLYHHRAFFGLYLCAPVYKTYQQDDVLNLLIFVKDPRQREQIHHYFAHCDIVDFPDCIEIRPEKTSKAKGVEFVRQKFLLEKTVCFGDGENDLDMIQQADIGLAMGNAADCLKQAADRVISSIDEDGIYLYFKEERLWNGS